MQKYLKLAVTQCVMLLMLGCSGHPENDSRANMQANQQDVDLNIHMSQIGYLPAGFKQAVVTATNAQGFSVRQLDSGDAVFTGVLSKPKWWPMSGDEVQLADFSALQTSGNYYLQIGDNKSHPFTISPQVYADIHDATMKAYYFNRAGLELLPKYAGVWARPAGHADTQVFIHPSAASANRPAESVISSPFGWYDAGDYGKYVVNSGISTFTLLQAWLDFPEFYQQRQWNIPESNNVVPDILDEVLWNLDWLITMQDPDDGGVYHKLTTKNFVGTVMPHETNAARYVVQKNTAATLNFAAVMAKASRVYGQRLNNDNSEQTNSELQNKALLYSKAAQRAWSWAQQFPDIRYQQPDDVHTGAYGDDYLTDEFSWAAAELYLTTQQTKYLDAFKSYQSALKIPAWPDTHALGYISLVGEGESMLTPELYAELSNTLLALAKRVVTHHQNSVYGVAMQKEDFVWGSNAVALNKAMVAMQGFKLSQQPEFLQAASGLLDYVLGKNPTGYSYVTGYGHKTPMAIHHRPSAADNVEAPVPGFVAGGAQPGQQDQCEYPSKLPAKSYIDDYCSYSTNEITINWNAPMVYMLAAMQSL